MDNLLLKIILGIIIVGVVYLRIKSHVSYSKGKKEFEGITPEYLSKKRMGMTATAYRKWLRHNRILFLSVVYERKDKGMSISRLWINNLDLLLKELRETEIKMGINSPEPKKTLSEELKDYKNIID